MTYEQEYISRHNKHWTRAKLNVPKGYDLHHVDMSLRANDIERYIEWRPEDLQILSHSEHAKLHAQLRAKDAEWRRKNSEANKKARREHPEVVEKVRLQNLGSKRSEESRAKMRAAAHHKHTKGSKGMHWYNNGTNDIFAYTCPDGYVKGRLNGKNPYRDATGKFANAEVIQ